MRADFGSSTFFAILRLQIVRYCAVDLQSWSLSIYVVGLPALWYVDTVRSTIRIAKMKEVLCLQ
jgi:hypothetical protein